MKLLIFSVLTAGLNVVLPFIDRVAELVGNRLLVDKA